MADPPPLPVGPSDELSPLDYLLYRGESQPATRSAFLNVEILDGPADWGRLREALERASRVVLRMRQKVVVPSVPVTSPQWVVDPDFDLDYHLRRVVLPGPGTLRQLLDLAEVVLQSPLDVTRALWEAVYVEGLDGGGAALLTKLSHAVTDGLGGIALFEQVYDTEREPAPRPMPPLPIPRDVTGDDLVRASLEQLPQTALSAGQQLLGAVAGTAARLIRLPGPRWRARSASLIRPAGCSVRCRPRRRRCCAAAAGSAAPSCSRCRWPTCGPRPRRWAVRSTTRTWRRFPAGWAGTTKRWGCRSRPCR